MEKKIVREIAKILAWELGYVWGSTGFRQKQFIEDVQKMLDQFEEKHNCPKMILP